MIFKERRFHQADPEDETLASPAPSLAAAREAEIADFLASLQDIETSEMTAVFLGGKVVLGGYAGSMDEVERIIGALHLRFPEVVIENRLRHT